MVEVNFGPTAHYASSLGPNWESDQVLLAVLRQYIFCKWSYSACPPWKINYRLFKELSWLRRPRDRTLRSITLVNVQATGYNMRQECLGQVEKWSRCFGITSPRKFPPAAATEMLRHTVWRNWLFIANSDEKWLYYQFAPSSLIHFFSKFGRITYWILVKWKD